MLLPLLNLIEINSVDPKTEHAPWRILFPFVWRHYDNI